MGQLRPFIRVLLLGLLVPAACAPNSTLHQREASLRALQMHGVDTQRLQADVEARAALLLSGRGVRQWATPDGHNTLVIVGSYGSGTAAIISQDGYLLTAAHCLHSDSTFLIFGQGHSSFFAPARTVWTGDAQQPTLDLALLKVDVKQDMPCFQWATPDQFQAQSSIILGGHREIGNRSLLTFAAGRITDPALRRNAEAGPPVVVLAAHAPFGKGDSGGPVVATTGQLIGIFTGWDLVLPATWQANILRPDPRWIAFLIEQDRRRHPSSQPSTSRHTPAR